VPDGKRQTNNGPLPPLIIIIMSDTQVHPPLILSTMAPSKPASAKDAEAILGTFMEGYDERVQGDSAVGAQLRRLREALVTRKS